MVLSTALRRYEYLDSLFNPTHLCLEKHGTKDPKYSILFGFDKDDWLSVIRTKEDFEKLIGWKE